MVSGGLQADMAVFRDLLGARLPKLAKHLQKLQGPMGEGELEFKSDNKIVSYLICIIC